MKKSLVEEGRDIYAEFQKNLIKESRQFSGNRHFADLQKAYDDQKGTTPQSEKNARKRANSDMEWTCRPLMGKSVAVTYQDGHSTSKKTVNGTFEGCYISIGKDGKTLMANIDLDGDDLPPAVLSSLSIQID